MRDYFTESILQLKTDTVAAIRSTLIVFAVPIGVLILLAVLERFLSGMLMATLFFAVLAVCYLRWVMAMHRLSVSLRSELVWTWTLLMLVPPFCVIVPIVLIMAATSRLKQAGMRTGILG